MTIYNNHIFEFRRITSLVKLFYDIFMDIYVYLMYVCVGGLHTCTHTHCHKFAFDILMAINYYSLFLALMLCILLYILKDMILRNLPLL